MKKRSLTSIVIYLGIYMLLAVMIVASVKYGLMIGHERGVLLGIALGYIRLLVLLFLWFCAGYFLVNFADGIDHRGGLLVWIRKKLWGISVFLAVAGLFWSFSTMLRFQGELKAHLLPIAFGIGFAFFWWVVACVKTFRQT